MVKQRTNRDKQNANLIEFKPGQSGNPAGRPKNSVTTLLKNMDELTNQQIADLIVKKVLKGEYSFVREYLDRTDGKVTDTHRIEGDIPISIIRRAVKE